MAMIRCARCDCMVDDDWDTCLPHALLSEYDLACSTCLTELDEDLIDECLADAADIQASYADYVERVIDKHSGTRRPLSMCRWAQEEF